LKKEQISAEILFNFTVFYMKRVIYLVVPDIENLGSIFYLMLADLKFIRSSGKVKNFVFTKFLFPKIPT
jgi:hypothetical protein